MEGPERRHWHAGKEEEVGDDGLVTVEMGSVPRWGEG